MKHRPVEADLANVTVHVLDGQGLTVLRTVSDDPFLLARLSRGRCDVKATFGGKTIDGTAMPVSRHSRSARFGSTRARSLVEARA